MKNLFTETSGVFSWRKAMTAVILVLFAFQVIGFALKNNFQEQPSAYMMIEGMIFAFYFAKEALRKVSLVKSADVQPDPNDPKPR